MAGSTPSEPTLTAAEVKDEADISPRGPAPDTSGKRVRAIPYKGGTTIVVNESDFKSYAIKQGKTVWDFRKDNFTVAVGDGKNNTLTQEAADFLTSKFPTSFEYLSQ